MKQPEVFKKIGGIIHELNEQYEYLQSSAHDLNDLELELFVANTHFLKDHAEILRKLNLIKSQPPQLPPHEDVVKTMSFIIPPPPVGTPAQDNGKPARVEIRPVPSEEKPAPASNEPKYFEPLVQQKPITAPYKPEPQKPAQKEPVHFEIARPAAEGPVPRIDLGGNTPADTYSFEREEPETIRHELVLDDTHDWEEEDEQPYENEELLAPEPAGQISEAEQPVPTNPEPVIGNEPKVKEDRPAPGQDNKPLSLNQRMAAKMQESAGAAAATVTDPPIQDIKTVINLNDKMLFIKDLFNGYPLAYSEAVEIVNRFKNFEEADRFLKTNYVTKNNWEAKKTTSDKFYALLRRRYA